MNCQQTFENVIAKVGTQAELARLLGKSASTVSYWRKSGIPAEMAVLLDKQTNGQVPLWVSRPDLWPKPKK